MPSSVITTSTTPATGAASRAEVVPTQLRLHDVSKTYSAKDGKVLDGVCLDIARGELVSLLGPSGCGKSTLLRMVAGFIRPDEGVIEIDGVDVTRVPTHKRNVGIVHQSHALWPHMTVAENIAFGLEMRKVKRRERELRVIDMLEVVGLAGFARRLPPELSGGQQQRVALARALVIEPQVLLLDEPLSSLDANLRVYLREEIRRIQRELGVTTVFVTHDREEAMAVSDRIVLLQHGNIAQQGAATTLYRQPDSQFIMSFTGAVVSFTGRIEQGPDGLDAVIDHGRFPLAGAASVPMAIGDEVTVSTRPEDIHVLHEGREPAADDLVFEAVLDDVAFFGTSVEARVTLSTGQKIEVRLHPRGLGLLPPTGETIRLAVDPGHLHVFAR